MAVNKLKFIAKENPSTEEIDELRMSLRAFNHQFAGEFKRTNLIHQVRDEEGKLVGGIFGSIAWDWLYIDLLWVDESVRGSGLGTELITLMEQTANAHGIRRYYLGTTSFQARGFYEKMGYTVCGEIEDFPPGHTNYFLKKTEV